MGTINNGKRIGKQTGQIHNKNCVVNLKKTKESNEPIKGATIVKALSQREKKKEKKIKEFSFIPIF